MERALGPVNGDRLIGVEMRIEEETIRDEWKLDFGDPESGLRCGPAGFETRRAGGKDLRELRRLLEESEVSNSEEVREVLASLERRVAEFILVVKEGVVAGCVGLEMFQQEGHLYGEAYVHPRMAELLRPVLWERVMRVATNHSLARIWTQLRDRFYEERGLDWACNGRKRELPRRFGRSEEAWRMVQWREEMPRPVQSFFEAEFAQEMQKMRFKRSCGGAVSQQRAGEIVRHVLPLIFALLLVLVFKIFGE